MPKFKKPAEQGEPENASKPSRFTGSLAGGGTCYGGFIESTPTEHGGVAVGFGNGDISRLLTSALPRLKRDRLSRAKWFSEHDDFLKGVLRVKAKFAAKGFRLTCSRDGAELVHEEGTAPLVKQAEIKGMLRLVSLQKNLYGIVKELMRCWFVYDSMILYWRVDPVGQDQSAVNDAAGASGEQPLSQIKQIMALDPNDCEWQNDQLQDRLLWRMPDELYNRIRQAVFGKQTERVNLLAELKKDGIPDEWIESVAKGQRLIVLSRDQGHNWIVRTAGPEQQGLVSPSMFTIFLFLEARRALRDGDFVAAYMMKHFIQHVTLGESIQNGPLAGSQQNWATPEEISQMQKYFAECVKAARLVTNHTIKINFVHPPKEMFETGKYVKPEAAIMHWASVPLVLLTGDGATNSSGYIGIQSTAADLEDCRRVVSEVFQLFFLHDTVSQSITELPDDYYVSVDFDQNTLKDPRQLLEELKFLAQLYWIGPETALTETGRDANRVRMEKRTDRVYNENTKVFEPISEASPAQVKNEGGRPPNPGTTQDQGTRTQPATI